MCRPKFGSFALLAISILSIGCQNSGQNPATALAPAQAAPVPLAANRQPVAEAVASPDAVDRQTQASAGAPSSAAANPVTMADAPALTHVVDPAAESAPITKDDVILWTARGASEEAIIDRILRGNAVFHLTAADENQLRDARVSDDVIRAMNDTGRRSF